MREILDILLWGSQITAFIMAVIQWKNYKNTTERYFVFFLLYVLFTEFIGYMIPNLYHINSQFVYNIFITLSYSFYLYWFSCFLKRPKLIRLLCLLFFSSIVCSLIFEDFFQHLWGYAFKTGAVLFLYCATLYYSDLLKQDAVINYLTSRKFWIISGLLIFHIGFLPLEMLQRQKGIVSSLNYRMALTFLNTILYGFITFGFYAGSRH
ncbi:MAG: hypothetical protein JKY08_08360 [Flavobacteriaceae bacterium]|nr:hypothetical protein [Flavobacteriaceae bacterium]